MNNIVRIGQRMPPVAPLQDAIRVPGEAQEMIDRLVAQTSRRTGEPPTRVRRSVELAVLTRGISAVEQELKR